MSNHRIQELTPVVETAPKPESDKRRLMLAVLEEALTTFQRGLVSDVAERRKHACEVETWVASDAVDWPFAFENVCDCLGIEPDYVRRRMNTLRRDIYGSKSRNGKRPTGVRRTRDTRATVSSHGH
jgi:hypothetical protein